MLEEKMIHHVNDGVIDEACSLANDHYERVNTSPHGFDGTNKI
jgi:hypothetical protein